jgi:hypothetical protein
MNRKPTNFTGISSIPSEGVNPGLNAFMTTIKQNLEVLMGIRGSDKAVLVSQIGLPELKQQKTTQSSASGAGYDIGGGTLVAQAEDVAALISDVNSLIADVAETRQYLNELVNRLQKG